VSRSQRLLDLLQLLRRHRYPVTGAALAAELGISLRSLYRDIATLQQQGACIEGEPGLGYVLKPGFTLPPLMFTDDEIEALVLGTRWVAERGDGPLATAARDALAKITAVLPAALQDAPAASTLLVGPGMSVPAGDAEMQEVRRAIKAQHKIDITYRDLRGAESTRTVWPFALGYFDDAHVVVAWCELRASFRHFRADRMAALVVSGERYPRRRQVLLKEWRETEGIALQQ
jgi:predicted DNA-binding transcriptional regulator YafY